MSEVSTGELIAGLDDADVLAIVGPVQWHHVHWECNCHEGEPGDGNYMSRGCIESWNRGHVAQAKRIENLRLLLSGKAEKVREAREQHEIITTFGVQGI